MKARIKVINDLRLKKFLINKLILLISYRKCIENSVENMNSDVRV